MLRIGFGLEDETPIVIPVKTGIQDFDGKTASGLHFSQYAKWDALYRGDE